MELVHNDMPIEQALVEAVEEILEEFLREVANGKQITLSEIYGELGVRYTDYRTGSLDNLILHILLSWNWQMKTHGWDGKLVTFERRKVPTECRSIRFANGQFLKTTETYPPPRRDWGTSDSEMVRAKIFAARKERSSRSSASKATS